MGRRGSRRPDFCLTAAHDLNVLLSFTITITLAASEIFEVKNQLFCVGGSTYF